MKSLIIKSASIDFGTNSKYQFIENGRFLESNIAIKFKEDGYKKITLSVLFNDGTKQTTHGKLHVKLISKAAVTVSNRSCGGNNNPIEDFEEFPSTISFKGYDESSPIYGELDYRVFYRTNNGNTSKTLQKPIIIIDGFDPGDKRKIQDSDSPKPANEHNSIEEMMVFGPNRTPIIPLLRCRGFDVVIVNHPTYKRNGVEIDGGADYIERNGRNHVSLYNALNAELAENGSNEELVIVGPSMGGQISRYALAYMEKHNIDHNTRLWVSIDSPHLGANIPIGAQALLNVLKNVTGSVGAADFVNNQLGSAAAKQQLIEQYNGTEYIGEIFGVPIYNNELITTHMDGKTVSQGYSVSRGHPFFKQYYDNLFNNGLTNSNGYPQNLRKVAIVNGSLLGNKKYKNPYQLLGTQLTGTVFDDNFANHGTKAFKIKGDANVIGHIVTLESYFQASTNNHHKLAYFKKKKFLGWNYYHRYGTNINSRGNMDNISGGWFPTQRDIAEDVLGTSPGEPILGDITNWSIVVNDWDLDNLKHVSSFIPTISALGFNDPDINWSQSLTKNLVCNNKIPFDSYFGPDDNEAHTSFTESSVNWLLKELGSNNVQPIPQDPRFPVSSSNLVGSPDICKNNIKTYTFRNCSTPENVVSWAKSSNLQIISSTANSITVKAPADSRSSGWVKATFSNGETLTKNIWVGKPNQPASINGPTIVNTGVQVNYNAGIAPGATSYEWRLPYPFDVSNPIDYFSDNWQMVPTTGRYLTPMTGHGQNPGYVQVMGVNSCGIGGAKVLFVSHYNSDNDDVVDILIDVSPRLANEDLSTDIYNTIKVYPNPANNIVNIAVSKKESNKYIKVLLFDNLGRLISDINSEGETLSIDTSILVNGIYVLKIFSDNYRTTKKVVVQH
ncbi:T9SS type A sorting domain-containing protein [uncultured Lacinutrix sp.]|uniref:T9SS type A sorting domain-containing protein n=1 Tax=uncultured Lacinutrix sp. TaxID=574032 RepID=UPI0026020DB8|nr:T9SS type A sorting domain-containing protein [uncultured Lacinutrix sp.]